MSIESRVIADDDAAARFKAIGDYLLAQEELAPLLEDALMPDARGRHVYNLPLIVQMSTLWLLRDLDSGKVEVEVLNELAAQYNDHPRNPAGMAHIRLSDSVVQRLEKITAHLTRLGVKLAHRQAAPNRQGPLNVAVLYAYRLVNTSK